MTDKPDRTEIGRQMERAFDSVAEGLRRFAEAWNGGHMTDSAPMLSRILDQKRAKPTA